MVSYVMDVANTGVGSDNMKKKKISKEEMEDILHDEEVEARWKSIKNSKRIKKAEADEKFWKEHLDPFYDEMFPHTPAKAVSKVVKSEVEEYKENNIIFKELDVIEHVGVIILSLISLIWPLMGLLFILLFFIGY